MDRQAKILTLEAISKGEATVEDLKPKHMVFKIVRSGNIGGLFVNGVKSNRKEDMRSFSTSFSNKEVKVHRV